MKTHSRVLRKDNSEDHVHSLPNGIQTGGMLMKPSSTRFGWHSHLYQLDGVVYETGPAHNEAGHAHASELGETSGPMKSRKDSAERKDSVQLRGSTYCVVSVTGHVLGRHHRLEDAEKQLATLDKDG